jgi:hypothetical protein
MITFSEKYVMSINLFIFIQLIIGFIIMFTKSRITGAVIALTAIGFLVIELLIILYSSFYNNLASIKVDIETPVVLEDGDETDTHSIDSHNDVFISEIEHV